MDDITDNDLLTWELQLAKEGTLPPETQRRLLAQYRAFGGYDDGYADGLADGAAGVRNGGLEP